MKQDVSYCSCGVCVCVLFLGLFISVGECRCAVLWGMLGIKPCFVLGSGDVDRTPLNVV